MCGLADCSRCGMACCEQRNVPRVLTWCIRSNRFIGVSSVPVRLIAEALFTRMSMPPKRSHGGRDRRRDLGFITDVDLHRERLAAGRSTSAAAVWIVPGNFGCGVRRLCGNHDVGAVGGGAQRNGVADAARGAGNEEGPDRRKVMLMVILHAS